MKFLTRDVIKMYAIIAEIANREDLNTAPVKIKFLLVRNARALEPIWTDFMETRRELLINNSSLVEDSEERSATQEQVDFINSEIEKLEKIEVEVPICPIPLSDLDTLNLSIPEMDGLYPIIANEEA